MTQPIQVSSDPAFMEMKAEVEERKKNEEELRAELTKMRQEMQSFMESITQRGAWDRNLYPYGLGIVKTNSYFV